MTLQLKIIRQDLFDEYRKQLKVDIETAFASIKKKAQTVEDFKFYLANSSYYSCSPVKVNTLARRFFVVIVISFLFILVDFPLTIN